VQTPYEQRLWDAARDDHTNRHATVWQVLKEMIAALESDRYEDLPNLLAALPTGYRSRLDPPPVSRDTDS